VNDDELRSRFSRLREQDAVQAPDFDAMRNRITSRARADRPMGASLLRYAAAAVLVIAAGLLVHRLRNVSETKTDHSVPAIGSWESPTASLLAAPSRELLDPPPLLSSVLDGVSAATLSRKGD